MPNKFFIDECADTQIAVQLRRRGVDAITCKDAKRRSFRDATHLEFCRDEQRVIFSHDPDFVVLHNDGAKHAGIVWCHLQSYSLGEMIEILEIVHHCSSPEEMDNHLEIF